MLALRYGPASPFVRKVLVFAHEAGIVDRIQLVPTDVWSTETDIHRDNPLGKVPALSTPDGVLCDSTLICEYLDSLHDRPKLFPAAGTARWTALRLHALCNGLLDAAVARVVEERRRPEPYRDPGNVARQTGKIRWTLDALEADAALLDGPMTIAGVAAACALGYLDFRLPELAWRDDHPRLAAWYVPVEKRASMQATIPRL